ncbi:MAG: hydrogenase 4 subunit F [Bacteroidales bacterium]|nr:hydrogenase 4 subunit F [Bacteroidales bacterium]
MTPLIAVLTVPSFAVAVLVLSADYRLSAGLNVAFSALSLAAAVWLLISGPFATELFLVDDFNIYLILLNAFIGCTTAIFSAAYIGHELETGRLTPRILGLYHAMYQAMMGAMVLALISNNIGLMWVGIEVATVSTVMMVGIYRTPQALEAAWKYFILGSVGIALAFLGTIFVYVAAEQQLGGGLASMAWTGLKASAATLDAGLLSLAFVFLLVGYGTKAGLAPLHAWLPDAHAEGPTPVSAVLSGLLLNVALYALLRFKIILAGNPATIPVGPVLIVMGLVSLIFAALMLYRRSDIKRFFAYSSIEHMGIVAFAFGMGGPLANFAGLMHMTMHSLTKSAIFFTVGHIAQVTHSQRFADIRGLSASHPGLAVAFAFGVLAIAGLPPFGVFVSEFLVVSSSFARQPLLAVPLAIGLLIGFGALIWRLQDVLFGTPNPNYARRQASLVPVYIHMIIVLVAGLWLPDPVRRWFETVAAQLG